MRFSGIVICGPGKVRKENQDNFYLNGIIKNDPTDAGIQRIQNQAHDRALYAVADGMGGEQHGEMASWFTVRGMSALDCEKGADGVVEYLGERNAEICRFIVSNGGVRSGSTFVGLCMRGGEAEIINIGDSRAYLLRRDRLYQISKDHTLVSQMLNLGTITKEQARTHPERHKLTQHLGIFPDEMLIEPYTGIGKLEAGDLFLLCSDGLYDMLDDEQIKKLLMNSGSLSERAAALYAAAMDAGGRDNITVLLIGVEWNESEELDQTI